MHFSHLFKNQGHPFVKILNALYGICLVNKLDKDLSDHVIFAFSLLVGQSQPASATQLSKTLADIITFTKKFFVNNI